MRSASTPLRHAHATELVNSAVSIEIVCRRLGHAPTETAQVYVLLADKVADAVIRAAVAAGTQTPVTNGRCTSDR